MLEQVYSQFLTSSGVTTDSRAARENSIFIGLRGPNFNGSSYARAAIEKGACLAVVDDAAFAKGDKVVVVDDSLKFLQELALKHRRQLDIPIVGLTGSNGKTTTKELIHAVLSRKYTSLATRGNLNNHIGVPLTLLELNQEHEIAIVEMGANHLGEITALCQLACPTHGLITNIGRAHTEGFGGFEGVVRGKSELYQYLKETDGTVFINSRQEILNNMAKRFPTPIMYPGAGDYYHCELTSAEPYLTIETEYGELTTQLIGHYNFDNVATALCLGKFFGVNPALANQAITEYEPMDNRSQVLKRGNVTIIMDAYNANPSSMQAALESLLAMKASRKAVILGDMFELGQSAEEEHRELGKLLQGAKIDQIFLCGKMMGFANQQCPKADYFENTSDLKTALDQFQFDGFTVLVKGSRGMKLEEVVSVIS